ncbi:MAG: hypothetical protein LBP21_01910 [Synergistaceae bacterium]|jgi:hypothetical protein|nr:hypothetical protein [Synergistaceae bacterium]
MPLTSDVLRKLTKLPPGKAWALLVGETRNVMYESVSAKDTDGKMSEIARRDQEVGLMDHFLSSVGWDLWKEFGNAVPKNSQNLKDWQRKPYDAKAILILDCLSLREMPLLLKGADTHGFSVLQNDVLASELPGETTEFARALGFSSRSQLQSGGAKNANFPDFRTESVNYPWRDCAGLIDASKNWIFWHHWPDGKVHENSSAGAGLTNVLKDAEKVFESDDFWDFAAKLAKGRRLVITSDHGYAFTGSFIDADGAIGTFLKEKFSGGRNTDKLGDVGPYAPPVLLELDGISGTRQMALGRRKWKSQGGYPVLTHGGLSLLEVLCPFVELSKTEA